MDANLLLESYCNSILGESKVSSKKSEKVKKQNNKGKNKDSLHYKSDVPPNDSTIPNGDEKQSHICDVYSLNENRSIKKKKKNGKVSASNKNEVTEDEFKIISEVPSDDDSNISNGCKSDIDDQLLDTHNKIVKNKKSKLKNKKKIKKNLTNEKCASSAEPKFTEDGFKVISQIPPDDSDVSDAFESDIEDELHHSTNKGDSKSKLIKNENNLDSKIKNAQKDKKKDKNNTSSAKAQFTEDGFKIISDIPSDDSDISDAFESDIEDELLNTTNTDPKDSKIIKNNTVSERKNVSKKNKSSNPQFTEDGFKIVSYIPSDDSDISDAFENDIDNEKDLEYKFPKQVKENDGCVNLAQIKKKPLRKLIEDFGIENLLLNKERSQPEKSKRKQNITIIDYSKRRGANKESKIQENKETKPLEKTISKKEADTEFKNSRTEIYRFGLSGGKGTKNAKIEMAIKLGAKPFKKENVNYKKLIEERKKSKDEERRKREEDREMGMPVKKPKDPKRFKRKAVDTANPNPKIGKFDGAVLKLSKKDIEKITR